MFVGLSSLSNRALVICPRGIQVAPTLICMSKAYVLQDGRNENLEGVAQTHEVILNILHGLMKLLIEFLRSKSGKRALMSFKPPL